MPRTLTFASWLFWSLNTGSGSFEEQPPNGIGGEGASLRGGKMDYSPTCRVCRWTLEFPGGPLATCIWVRAVINFMINNNHNFSQEGVVMTKEKRTLRLICTVCVFAVTPQKLVMNCDLWSGDLFCILKITVWGGAWVAQSVKRPTSAQVMISQSVSSSPASGSVLTAQSLEPISDSVSPSLWPSPVHALSLSVSKINKH